MPSHLRHQLSFQPVSANANYSTASTLPPSKKPKMSLTQTYYVASTARSKLGREAGRADHKLRLLVGHANLLDSLMVELADAEREQEAWFDQSVKKASKAEQPRHIRWMDSIDEEQPTNEADSDSESDDGSDISDEDMEMFSIPVRKLASPAIEISSEETEVDEDYDEEFDDEHTLTRVESKHSPPELTHEADSDSEDESMPPSPEQSMFRLSEKERQSISTSTFYEPQSKHGLDNYMMQQSPSQSPFIAAC